MRIIAGHLGGRPIPPPPRRVRPTQDRIRKSLFDAMGGRMDGWRVADLFAGSGALGLEAWSRGAAAALWVERDSRVFARLRQTVRALCSGPGAVCRRADALRWRWARPDDIPFDAVFADPPYDVARQAAESLLRGLADRGMVRAWGWVALEMAGRDVAPSPHGWRVVRDRVLGGTRVVLYRKTGPAAGRPEEQG